MPNLTTDQFDAIPVTSFDEVRRHLSAMAQRKDGFLILSRADEDYVQLARTPNGFHIERRSGSADAHEIAASTISRERYGGDFNMHDASAVLQAYFDRLSDAQSGAVWEKMDMDAGFSIYATGALIVILAVIAAGAYFVLR